LRTPDFILPISPFNFLDHFAFNRRSIAFLLGGTANSIGLVAKHVVAALVASYPLDAIGAVSWSLCLFDF